MTYLYVKTFQGPPSPLPIPQPPTWFADLHLDRVHLNVTFPIFLNKRFQRTNNEMSVIYKYVTWHIYMLRQFRDPHPLSLYQNPQLDLHLNKVLLNVIFLMFWNKRFLGTKHWNVSDYKNFFYKYVTWHIYMLRQFRD